LRDGPASRHEPIADGTPTGRLLLGQVQNTTGLRAMTDRLRYVDLTGARFGYNRAFAFVPAFSCTYLVVQGREVETSDLTQLATFRRLVPDMDSSLITRYFLFTIPPWNPKCI
jgi:hypothetical protein